MHSNLDSNGAVLATVTMADEYGAAIDIDRLHCSLIRTERSLLETSIAVDDLVSKGKLCRRGDLVCLADHEQALHEHDNVTARAAQIWPDAQKWAARIGRVPFVRLVAVTGSLALDVAAADATIDLFIVVRPRRLWTTRLLILRVARSAAKAGITLRPVYIATTRAPELTQQSAALAWELAHVAIVIGEQVNRTLRRSNDWIFEWLPNASLDGNLDHHIDYTPSAVQKWTETLLLFPPFRPVENWNRRRQIRELRNAATAAGFPAEHRDRFSVEICDEHLGARAAAITDRWQQRVTDR